jgi:hypothetical protein
LKEIAMSRFPKHANESQRAREIFEHVAYLQRVHSWTLDEAIAAMRYYNGDLTMEQLRYTVPTKADEIIDLR